MAHHSHHSHHQHDLAQEEPVLVTGDEFTEKNREHWDKYASSYTSEQWQRDMVNEITSFVLTHKSWLGVPFLEPASQFELKSSQPQGHEQIRVLDYACGPGTLTSALAGLATEYVGIDLSANMVKAYNTRFGPPSTQNSEAQASLNSAELKTEEMNAHAIVGNLLHPSNPTPSLEEEGGKYKDFDLAMVSGGFHHFEDPALAAKRLTERLKPGGVLMVLDFLSHDKDDIAEHHQHGYHAPSGEADSHGIRLQEAMRTIAHHGFSEEKIKSIFVDDAGLKDVDIKIMPRPIMMGGHRSRTGFMCRGVKP